MKKPIDQDVRDDILKSNHQHYLISASTGSGKTTILCEKAFSIVDKNFIKTYQQIAMITFTRLATRQIRDKVIELISKREKSYERYLKNLKIATTESFVLSELIKPFIRDALGKDFPGGENLIQNYNSRFIDFDSGLLNIKTGNIIGSYEDVTKNFTYQLALEILENSENARKYFKSRFPIVMVDEYQDVDYDMHSFYMYLKNELNVRLVLVGDIKQMLYSFRGADEAIMESLQSDDEFKKYQLIENFRSHLSIVNYSYQFFKQDIEIPHIHYKENRVRLYSDIVIKENIRRFINEISSKEDDIFAFLFARRNQWNNEKYYWEDKGFVFIDNTPLDSSYPNYDVLEPVLKLYFDSSNYNIYNLLDDLDVEIKNSTVKKATKIRENLETDISKVLKMIEELTEKNLLEDEKLRFIETLDEKYRVNFVSNRPKRLALTIHGAKGLEFDHVFIDADSFYDLKDKFLNQNHYVAITRAKKSLHILINDKYESLLQSLGIFQLNS
jgi:superfamily I DNA/RNA helicase